MTTWKRRTIVLVVIAVGVASAACGDQAFVPATGPTVSPPPPPGTLVRGVVLDTVFRVVAGARVEVVDGSQAGTSTTSNTQGEYSLTGSFDGSTRFRASKEGHIEQVLALSSCPACGSGWIPFYLDVVASPVNIAGSYALTFVADSSCDSLPENARTRSYAATITPASSRSFQVTFEDAPFLQGYNFFTMTVAGEYIVFSLGDAHGTPGLVERLGANTYLAFDGGVAATAVTDVSRITLSFVGFLEYCEVASEMGRVYRCDAPQVVTRAACTSGSHRVTLTRR